MGDVQTTFQGPLARLSELWRPPHRVEHLPGEEHEVRLWAETSLGPLCVWRRTAGDLDALVAAACADVRDADGPAGLIPR